MTTPLIGVDAIEARTGTLTAEDRSLVESLLGEASDLAREIGLSSWTDEAGANPAPVSVRLTIKAAVLRAYYEPDPDGYTSQTIGDWSGARDAGSDEIGVYFTPREESRIAQAAKRRLGVGSVRTPSAYEAGGIAGTVYVPVSGANSSPVPWY